MTRCLVTLGAFDARGDGWLLELDAGTGGVRERLHVDPPAPLRVAGKGFSGAARLPNDRLAVCGAAAIYLIRGDRIVETWACPSFNDLHGLTVCDERVWVANTGLDAVDVLNLDGRFIGSHSFDPHWINARRLAGETPSRAAWPGLLDTRWKGAAADFEPEAPPGLYYQTGGDLPISRRIIRDRVHPNHVTIVGGRPWITCLALSAVVDGMGFDIRARFDAPPHDGQFRDERVWFSRVDGIIEARDVQKPDVPAERCDVSEASGVFGWCRGLLVTDDVLWVGYTEMRRAPRYPWARSALEDTRTAVVCLDRKRRRVVRVFDLSLTGRHTKVGALVGMP